MRRLTLNFAAILVLLSVPSAAFAKELSVLFIGNSYTYLPGQGDAGDPALPKLIGKVLASVDPELKLNIRFHTPGGYSFRMHLEDEASSSLLDKKYDQVILQGQSIESLELTPWWEESGNPGMKGFEVSLPEVLDRVFKKNSRVALYVNWGWNPRNPLLQDGHPGLRFPEGHPKAGQKWCGKDKFDFQRLIDESYVRVSAPYSVTLARVGDAWIGLQESGLVSQDELYLPDDWSHPSVLGSFITALVMARDVFRVDVRKNGFVPQGVAPARADAIEKALASALLPLE